LSNFKTSYILTKNEILFLFGCFPDVVPTDPARYVIETYLSDCSAPQAAVEGLVYKKLAKKTYEKIVLEPVVDLLVKSALSSKTLWIADFPDIEGSVLVLRSDEMCFHIRRYPLISDAWKITPYQKKEHMSGEFEGLTLIKATRIDKDGKQEIMDNDSWMEDSILI